jgi:uncharacterized OsmC-like protein
VRTCEIEQLGEVMEHRFTLGGGHPPELLGHNIGPPAIETLLAALDSCLAGTFAAQATGRGVALESIEVDLEGAIDLNGLFGLRPAPPALTDVRVAFRVESDADDQTLAEILAAAKAHSPVHDTVGQAGRDRGERGQGVTPPTRTE